LLRQGNPKLNDRELAILFNSMDKNHDERISFDEFVDWIYSTEGESKEARIPQAPPDVQVAFKHYCENKDGMNGNQFRRLCYDCGLCCKKFKESEIDIYFTKVRNKSDRTIGLRQFEKVLYLIAQRVGCPAADIHQAVGDKGSGGHVAQGTTKAEAVRFHDDKSTYTGTHVAKDDLKLPPVAAQGPGRGRSPGPSSGALRASRSPPTSAAPSSATGSRERKQGAPAALPEISDGELDWNKLDRVFEMYCASKDKANLEMDGTHFAKICADCKLFDTKFSKTDADILYTKILWKGERRIGFPQFVELLKAVAGKKDVAQYFVHQSILLKGGHGPEMHATKADVVRFHDDKTTYTGTKAH
jgi:hypothetical protein